MDKKFGLVFILSCLLVINSLFLVSAAYPNDRDDKVKVKICEFAISNQDVVFWEFEDGLVSNPGGLPYISEDTVFKPWDNINKNGTFMWVDNLDISKFGNSDYNVTRVNNNWKLWNNNFEQGSFLNWPADYSNIPVINVGSGNDKWLYTKCRFEVFDFRIFIGTRKSGFTSLFALTDDFNLTTSTVPVNSVNTTNPPISSYSNLVVDEKPEKLWVNNLRPGEQGFFPNDKPYIIYRDKKPLSKFPTSWLNLSMKWILRDTLSIELTSNPSPATGIIYINNSDPTYNASKYLKPTVITPSTIRTNENRSNSTTGERTDTNKSMLLELWPGEIYTVQVPFNNTYNKVIWVNFTAGMSTSKWTQDGGLNLADVKDYPNQDPQKEYTNVRFAPGETILINNTYFIPESNATHDYHSKMCVNTIRYANTLEPPTDDFLLSGVKYTWLGGDNYPYITYSGIDPRITMRWNGTSGKYDPIFNVTVGIKTWGWEGFGSNIVQGVYILKPQIFTWDPTIPGTRVEWKKEYALPNALILGENATPFNFTVDINPDWGDDIYFSTIYAEMNRSIAPHENFYGKDVTVFNGWPYFKPGDITYDLDTKLHFGTNQKMDSRKIIIFNPTFYENDFQLDITGWSAPNFTLSWESENDFSSNNHTITLAPLQHKLVDFTVNATYDTWPATSRMEDLNITLSSSLESSTGVEENIAIKEFTLNVSNSSLSYFDIEWLEPSPNMLSFNDLGATTRETFFWEWRVTGAGAAMNDAIGRSYTVNINLTNRSNNEVLETVSGTFPVTGPLPKTLTLSLPGYDFPYGKYSTSIYLDSTYEFVETTSSGDAADDTNFRTYDIPSNVTGCWQNTDTGNIIMYRGDYTTGGFVDEEELCDCPDGFENQKGHCASDYDEYCWGLGPFDVCNDITQTLDARCGWNSTISPPGDITDGNCLMCSEIGNSCGGYNNNESCIADPCGKAEIDEEGWGTDAECFWNDTSYECDIDIIIGGTSCEYDADILQECGEGIEKMVVNYTSSNVLCTGRLREMSCGQEAIAMSFFTTFNLISVIGLITLFYFGREFRRKK